MSEVTARTVAIGLACAPAEVSAAVAGCVESVRGCELAAAGGLDEAADLILNRANLAALIVYVPDAAQAKAVRRLVQAAEERRPAVPVIVAAESNPATQAVDFIEMGAADCLFRPLNLSRLTFLIDFLTLRRRCAAAMGLTPSPQPSSRGSGSESASAGESNGNGGGGLVFASGEAEKLRQTAAKLADVEATVLLHGETGSGKTRLARFIHELSPRRKKPFVVANCGSLPESLIESELFGHRQGAFTGADRDHRGKFSQAEDGTLFLDEIDSLSLVAQSKLLRVVEDRSFEPVGSERTERVRSRLIFATNRDLGREVEAGRFRQDLYYRLNVIAVEVPPLRSRVSEIPALVETYLREVSGRHGTKVKRFSAEALEVFARYAWPGNLRELRNVVERVAVLCDREVAEVEDLPAAIRGVAGFGSEAASSGPAVAAAAGPADAPRGEGDFRPLMADGRPSPLAATRRAAERQEIVRTLAHCGQNRSLAAEMLGISRTAFYKKLRQLGIA